MLIFNNKASLKAHLEPLIAKGMSVGFVPTMGALHAGHLSLMSRSVADNDITVVSIFVNPTQFNNPEDLQKYPRTLDTDTEKIAGLNPQIIIFAPTVDDMYEGNTASASFTFGGLENQMEGSHRPGHFNGVGTIVKKLFQIVKPARAYFGEKDFQQLQIVKRMVQQEQMPVEVIGCPITREASGLAMSSRNQRLTEEERNSAAFIYRTLEEARGYFNNRSIAEVNDYVIQAFAANPAFEMEYFEIADEETLQPAKIKENKKYRAFIAVVLSNVRLIDNISLN